MSEAKVVPVFGEHRICKRCGKLSAERYGYGFRFPGQGDAWSIEYCEHCKPVMVMDALADLALDQTRNT